VAAALRASNLKPGAGSGWPPEWGVPSAVGLAHLAQEAPFKCAQTASIKFRPKLKPKLCGRRRSHCLFALDSTRIGSARLDSTRLDSTRLDSTRLDSTRLAPLWLRQGDVLAMFMFAPIQFGLDWAPSRRGEPLSAASPPARAIINFILH